MQVSKETVPVGTDYSSKESEMKRTLTIATAVLMLAASGVHAQQAPAEQPRYRSESQWSPLTYEYLGATPKVDLSKLFAPKAPKAEARGTETERATDTAKPAAPSPRIGFTRSRHGAAEPVTN